MKTPYPSALSFPVSITGFLDDAHRTRRRRKGQMLPDFAEIRVTYVPDARCIELKALKYYLIGFRNRGIFYEQVTNQILDDLVAVCSPRRMVVVGNFSVRGGITTTVTASYETPEYSKKSKS